MTIDQARQLQWVARWHRRVALVVVLWMAWLAGTGFLVNHANDWGLDRAELPGSLQSWVYGVTPSQSNHCSGLSLPGADCSTVFARLDLTAGAALLDMHRILLLDGAGELLESLPVAQLGLSRLDAGRVRGEVILLLGPEGMVSSDHDFLDYRLAESDAVDVGSAEWQVREQGIAGISWERFVLDLHAARFLGSLAKVFNDVMAGLILLLAVSGVWMFRARNRNNGANGRS